jgi:Ala-tRNA(Pro) deacylase
MAVSERLRAVLAMSEVAYDVLSHREEMTSQRVAQALHVSGKRLAKVVVVVDPAGEYLMAAIPADCRVDLAALEVATGRRGLRLAVEAEVAGLFPDCEVGAMPPFGRLYGLPLYLDGCFRALPDILFQAGNHRELVRMRYGDYETIADPFVGPACFHRLRPNAYGRYRHRAAPRSL